jgi:hypothetical protein
MAQQLPFINRLGFWLLYLILASGITAFMLWNVPFNGFEGTLIFDVVEGNAHRPYVYRALLPALLRALQSILPLSVLDSIVNWAGQQSFIVAVQHKQHIPPHAFPAFLGLIATTFTCFLIYFATLRALFNHFYELLSRYAIFALCFAAFLTILFTQTHSFLIYDPGTLMFSALLLLFLARRQWLLFFPTFALATINKETTVLLIPLLYLSRPPRALILASVAFLFWGVLFLLIRWQFRDNIGSGLEFHLIDQWQRVTFEELVYLGSLAFLAFLLCFPNWSTKPLLLRQFVFICGLPLLIFLLFFGIVYEIRVFHEVVPALFLLSFPSIVNTYKRFRNITSIQ